jgi:hypothetical protein
MAGSNGTRQANDDVDDTIDGSGSADVPARATIS